MHKGKECATAFHVNTNLLTCTGVKTAILSWLQNDGTRGFSKDQLKGKQLSLMFQPDALVIFNLALKTTRASGQNFCKSCLPLSWSLENPLVPSCTGVHCVHVLCVPGFSLGLFSVVQHHATFLSYSITTVY